MKYLKLMRVKHYMKNFLIFLPIIFSKNLFNLDILKKCIVAFISFSLISSVIYIINDLKDVEKDKNHPVKKYRPIASGSVSKKCAIFVLVLLIIVDVLLLYITGLLLNLANIFLIIYLVINILYSFGLKNIPLLDIAILSFGFVLRVLYGGSIVSIPISSWLFLTVVSVSFYMALGKRKKELVKLKSTKTRSVLKYYTEDFLEKNMYMFLTLIIVFYSMWAILAVSSDLFIYSIIFVIIILLKYNLDIDKDGYGDPVDVILGDKILISIVLIYCLFCFTILYIV